MCPSETDVFIGPILKDSYDDLFNKYLLGHFFGWSIDQDI